MNKILNFSHISALFSIMFVIHALVDRIKRMKKLCIRNLKYTSTKNTVCISFVLVWLWDRGLNP